MIVAATSFVQPCPFMQHRHHAPQASSAPPQQQPPGPRGNPRPQCEEVRKDANSTRQNIRKEEKAMKTQVVGGETCSQPVCHLAAVSSARSYGTCMAQRRAHAIFAFSSPFRAMGHFGKNNRTVHRRDTKPPSHHRSSSKSRRGEYLDESSPFRQAGQLEMSLSSRPRHRASSPAGETSKAGRRVGFTTGNPTLTLAFPP